MRIRVLYFGVLRKKYIKEREEKIGLSDAATVSDLLAELCRLHPDFATVQSRIRLAVNEDFAPLEQQLAPGDVVALIPPVARGAEPYCRLTEAPPARR